MHCITPDFTAAARSASSRTSKAGLPPSSCATRLTVGAALIATWTLARVDPVMEAMSTSGCNDSAAPTDCTVAEEHIEDPSGPASCMISAKIRAFRGEISEALSTTVQPFDAGLNSGVRAHRQPDSQEGQHRDDVAAV
ncbi:hypothetical protein CNE_BB1p00330 (plasmid) [Cupriavidus necator N-1]|uniref:Uncharacterized protein n=1 Tax=Cupriavidus necator (strain ATCC 43291 / DSM 13513 / CCUG 52238 / LMG 8453 / N-1) TaxID=1042878 RepID=F8GV39_CUPNN|nr:hypothetical protein CNE_BB1p00330 [Cupriavidus necator N-1]